MINDIAQFVGLPFLNRGRTFSGCDCWGLVVLVYKKCLNIELPSYDINQFKIDEVSKAFDKEKKNWSVVKDDITKFDVAEMFVDTHYGKRLALHVGIVLDNNHLLHTEKNIGSHIVKYRQDFMVKSRIKQFWRYNDK